MTAAPSLQPAPFSSDPATMRFRDRVRARIGIADLLVFRVGEERFAVELRSVDEAVESPAIHGVPESIEALLGVFRHRERLVPLYSCASMLGVSAGAGATALVMRSGTRHVGVAVDEVEDVVHVDLTLLRDPPDDDFADDILLAVFLQQRALVAVLDARALLAAAVAAAVPTDL